MKPAQHPSRAESELITPSYARRPALAREPNPRTRPISHPGCTTRRWYITGAPSCQQSPPFPNATRDPSHETPGRSAPDHIHKKAMRATVEQRFHAGGDRQLGVHSRRRTMYRRKVIPSFLQCQCRGRSSLLPHDLRRTITVNTWTRSRRCLHRSLCA